MALFFWDHALDKKQIARSTSDKNKLLEMIAVPILLRKNLSQYKKLGIEINKIVDSI